MIPLTLVTGFLGSGKTTLLQQLARRHAERRIVWVVNEFSARDVDSTRLRGLSANVVSVTGGSIFCRCKATEYLDLLRSLPTRFQPEAVVIEASGIADPTVARKLLSECKLDHHYFMAEVIAVVDPGSFLKLLHTLPNIRTQVESATRVLINKIDLYAPAQIEAAEMAVRAIHASVPITRTQHCAMECDLFTVGVSGPLAGELAPCVDPRYVQFAVPMPADVDVEHLREVVAPVADDVYRIKGHVRAAGTCLEVDYSLAGWRFTETCDNVQPELVVIVRGDRSESMGQLLKGLRAR